MASEEDREISPTIPNDLLSEPRPEPRRRLTFPKHVQLDLTSRLQRPSGNASSVQLRSYSQSPFRSYRSSGAVTPTSRLSPRPSASVSTINLQHLLEKLELDQYDTYGVEELRDGFFDASFFRPIESVPSKTAPTISPNLDQHSLSFGLISNLYGDILDFIWTVFRTHNGITLAKSLLAYMICYIICLIPACQKWLGQHSYFALISVLLNHPGRTFGAQIDGTVLCITGAAVGIGWGCLALKLASLIGLPEARKEAVVEIFIIFCAGVLAWLRATFIRLYQALMSAGIASFFLCLVEPTLPGWSQAKVRDFAFPWLVGQAICLIINVTVFPGAGRRELAIALHNAFLSSLDGLVLPRPPSHEVRFNLNIQVVNLSEAFRDMRNEITLSRFLPEDIAFLRNTLQAIMRGLIAVDPTTSLFDNPPLSVASVPSTSSGDEEHFIPIDIDTPAGERTAFIDLEETLPALNLVKGVLADPVRQLIDNMTSTLSACDIELMNIAGYPQLPISNNIVCKDSLKAAHSKLKEVMEAFDAADASLIDHPLLPHSFSKHPELVNLFLFVHPLRQTADSVDILVRKVLDMVSRPNARSTKFLLPSYPWKKAFYRTNPQVRHDRGGATAGYYFQIKNGLDEIMGASAVRSNPSNLDNSTKPRPDNDIFSSDTVDISAEPNTKRYRIWRIIHRLQGFEARFAVKLALVTVFLSIPAWVNDSTGWYMRNESWWAVIAAWFMMHPRVGGNAEDLITRSTAVILGAVWGGLAYAAGKSNPYVMAVFTAIFIFPAIFRFTQSTHPRSGLMACMAFTVVSLSAYTRSGFPSVVQIAWTRGLAIVIGIFAAVLVNWTVWPFVARHELRKSISTMMLTLAITYSGIVARYIYHDQDMAPTKYDVESSQILESKLREGFIRMRELLEMTKHEIRIRGPFNPNPYHSLIDTLELFFEHLVQVRQASLYFQPFSLSEEHEKSLLSFRRDAVASILMNLYTMAAALRVKKPIPRYLPSAAVARKQLLDRMEESELETEEERLEMRRRSRMEGGQGGGRHRRWTDVYQFAYSAALTDIVGQLEELQTITKEICGEMALDIPGL